MRFVLLMLAIFTAALPARAEETAESYYGRLMKTCEYTVRESWRDYLLYAPHKRIDSCCAASVDTMRAGSFREIRSGDCPEGFQRNMMKCESTKTWCEPRK